jgi:hypothetical protein
VISAGDNIHSKAKFLGPQAPSTDIGVSEQSEHLFCSSKSCSQTPFLFFKKLFTDTLKYWASNFLQISIVNPPNVVDGLLDKILVFYINRSTHASIS